MKTIMQPAGIEKGKVKRSRYDVKNKMSQNEKMLDDLTNNLASIESMFKEQKQRNKHVSQVLSTQRKLKKLESGKTDRVVIRDKR